MDIALDSNWPAVAIVQLNLMAQFVCRNIIESGLAFIKKINSHVIDLMLISKISFIIKYYTFLGMTALLYRNNRLDPPFSLMYRVKAASNSYNPEPPTINNA